MQIKFRSISPIILLCAFLIVALWMPRIHERHGIQYPPLNLLLRRVLQSHYSFVDSQKQETLLMATWFLDGSLKVQMWLGVDQKGSAHSYRSAIYYYSPNGATSGALQNDFWSQLSDKKLQRLHGLIQSMPHGSIAKSTLSQSLDKLLILSVDTGHDKRTYFYNRKKLPSQIQQIAKIAKVNIGVQ